jgi:hypothetical protein
MSCKDASDDQIPAEAQQAHEIDSFELPKSVATKSESALPDSAKLQTDAVLALVKDSNVFISYLDESSSFPDNPSIWHTGTSHYDCGTFDAVT